MAEKSSASETKQPMAAASDKATRGVIGAVVEGVAKVWNAIMADGTIEAAGRQGLHELASALKAFPDAIQVQETGSIWNPTPGEVQKSREQNAERQPCPSEIAAQNRLQAGTVHGRDNGHDAGHENEASM